MKMPFSNKKKVNRNSPSIRAHKWIIKVKRAALFCSRGGITLEATLAMSVFMTVMVPVISLICYIDMQSNIQMNLENVARNIAQKSYYTNGIMDLDIVSENMDMLAEKVSERMNLDDESKKDIKSAAFMTLVAAMMTNECGIGNINDSFIVGGIAGISYEHSSYDSESGRITLSADYCVKLPFAGLFGVFESNSRVVSQSWIGKDISKNEDKVYITKTGKVYHKSLECRYLDIGIEAVCTDEIEKKRNKSGAKYNPCEYCDYFENMGTVYITDYGRRYHNIKDCSRLLRNVIVVEKSQVGDMPPCSICAKEDE